jgi:hypothetical protein
MTDINSRRSVALAVVALLLYGAAQAEACTCPERSRDQVIGATPVVFDGEILRVEMDEANLQQITTFRVRDAIKGVPRRAVLSLQTVFKRLPQRTISIVSDPEKAGCGWDFRSGPARLTVGAERIGPTLVATYCTMSALNSRRWIP